MTIVFSEREKRAATRRIMRRELYSFTAKAFSAVNPGARFIPNWHVEAMCWELMKVYRGETKRLLITVPPRHLKSICGSVSFPAWALGQDPGLKFAVVSYGDVLASGLHQNFRSVVTAPFYRQLFPLTQVARNTTDLFATTAHGERRAVTIGGPFTGFGFDIIIVDDPAKALDMSRPLERERLIDFYQNTMVSRLNDKNTGRIIIIAQRLHEGDMPGFVIERGNYVHLDLPAIAEEDRSYDLGPNRTHMRRRGDLLFPQIENAQALATVRGDIGEAAFLAQWQQNPTSADAARIRWRDVRRYDVVPETPAAFTVQSWDTAFSTNPRSDYSACTTWRRVGETWYLLDVTRGKWHYEELRAVARGLRDRWNANHILIEEANVGISLLRDLRLDRAPRRAEMPLCVITKSSSQQPKEIRFETSVDCLYSGSYLVPEAARWLQDLKRELEAFPNGKHDDQVDALTHFLHWSRLPRNRSAGLPWERPEGTDHRTYR